MVKNVYQGKPAVEQPKLAKPAAKNEQTVLEVFDEFIAKFEKRVERENASFETLKHWRSTKKKVAAFIKYHFDREDIHFWEVVDADVAYQDKIYQEKPSNVPARYSCESTPAFLSKGRQKFLDKVRHLKVA